MKQTVYYAVIRETEGEQWVDSSSIHLLAEIAEKQALDIDVKIPQWAKDNPIVKMAKVKITVIEDWKWEYN